MTIDVRLTDDLGDRMDMSSADSREEVVALRNDILARLGPRDAWLEMQTPYRVHDEYGVKIVDAYQRLVGWNRLRFGSVQVPADALCILRNRLDADLLNGVEECEDLLDELRSELSDDDDSWTRQRLAECEAALAERGWCGVCDWCRTIDLRDRCDAALDAAGFDGGVYYRTYR